MSQTTLYGHARGALEAYRRPDDAGGRTSDAAKADLHRHDAPNRAVAGWFLAKLIVFSAMLALTLAALEVLVASVAPWRRYEDPRARILWDGAFDGSRVVLLGDSVFASLYVDSPSEMLWTRLEAHSGRKVFPGALNGARARDVLAEALYVSREWPSGTTVFISLPPTRFLATAAQEPVAGNFADEFLMAHGIDVGGDTMLRRLRSVLYYRVLKPFFAERTRTALANTIDRPGQPRWMRNRVWTSEPHGAEGRFQFFERNLLLDADTPSFRWVLVLQQQLEEAGMQPVFVLTPLNEALVRRFASVYSAGSLLAHIRGVTSELRTVLERNGAAVVDLTDGLPSECFFDLVHPSACGDEVIARTLAAWLAQHVHD